MSMSNNLPAPVQLPAYDTIDVGQILKILRRRAGIIAIMTFGAAFLALLHVLFTVPTFTASGTLYLGDAQSSGAAPSDSGSGLSFLGDYSNGSDVETQIELITAGALVKNALLETGLNAQITPAGAPKLTFWRWKLYDHGQTDSFLPGPDTLQALYATTPGAYHLVIGQNGSYRLYTRASLLHAGHFLLTGQLGKPASGNGVQMLVQPASDSYQATPGKAYDIDIAPPVALAQDLQGGALTVISGGSATSPTKNAFLQFRWNNPYQGQQFVNQVMTDYIATQLSWQTQSASTTEDFVSTQLKNVSASLAEADEALAAYQSQTGVVDVPQNAQTIISQLAQYEQQRETLQLQQAALQQIEDGFEQSKGSLNPYLVNQADNTVPAELINSLSDEELKLSQLQATFTDATHDVQVEEAKVAEIKSAIRDTVRNDLAAANTNLDNLNQTIATLQNQLKLMPAESLKIVSLQRSSDVLGQLYVLLMKKQEEAQLSKAATIINTRIVTPADMPLGATAPKASITVLFGALVGLVAGIALAFGQRAFSGRFESEDQIRLSVPLPVYGAIPRRAKKEISNGIFDGSGYGPFFESFRLLRASISRIGEAGKPMVILIISAAKSDGKTTVATNLAKSLADDGRKVVLVDGDLHLSRLRSLRSETALGLTDWIKTGNKPEIENWPDEKFKLLGAGSTTFRGRGQLSEDRLRPIFENLRADFDYIILDSPPLPTVSDGLLLGAFADLVLSVVSVSHTPRRSFNIHNELINTLNCPHGIIINEVDAEYYGNNDAYFMDEPAQRKKYVGLFRLGRS